MALLLLCLSGSQPAWAQTKPPVSAAEGRRTFFPLAVSNPGAARHEDDQDPEMGGDPYVLKQGDNLTTLAADNEPGCGPYGLCHTVGRLSS